MIVLAADQDHAITVHDGHVEVAVGRFDRPQLRLYPAPDCLLGRAVFHPCLHRLSQELVAAEGMGVAKPFHRPPRYRSTLHVRGMAQCLFCTHFVAFGQVTVDAVGQEQEQGEQARKDAGCKAR